MDQYLVYPVFSICSRQRAWHSPVDIPGFQIITWGHAILWLAETEVCPHISVVSLIRRNEVHGQDATGLNGLLEDGRRIEPLGRQSMNMNSVSFAPIQQDRIEIRPVKLSIPIDSYQSTKPAHEVTDQSTGLQIAPHILNGSFQGCQGLLVKPNFLFCLYRAQLMKQQAGVAHLYRESWTQPP